MGVVANAKVNNSFKTCGIAGWIGLLKIKKNSVKYQKRKNLFIEAVLNKALSKAECELRHKQQERKLKWQHLRSAWLLDDKTQINLDSKVCEELNSSLDEFMLGLKTINVSVQR